MLGAPLPAKAGRPIITANFEWLPRVGLAAMA